MSDTISHDAASPPPSAPPPPSVPPSSHRRWPRRLLISLILLAAVLAAAFWYLGRESTLQMLVRQAANASGGQITVRGVSGSLYSRMHIDQLSYRSPTQHVTAEQLDIDWSPFQYLSSGLVINRLQVASATVESLGPATPATLPESLAAPLRIKVAQAQLGKLTLLNAGASNVIEQLRFQLDGDQAGWRLQHASASTIAGLVAADATIGALRPFALDAKASLTQSAPPAGQAAAKLDAVIKGSLALLEVRASATSNNATGDAVLSLAPFEPIILHAATINGRHIDPSRFNPAWPQADLSVQIGATIDARQALAGKLAITNASTAGPLDQQRLPLRKIEGTLAGSLTNSRIDGVLIDLGAAGSFTGGGVIGRSAPQAAIGTASFKLHTDRLDLHAIQGSLNSTKIAGDLAISSTGDKHSFTALLGQDKLTLDLQATLQAAQLTLQRAHLAAGNGSLDVSGQASLSAQQTFTASASASRFNPAAFGDYPAADLNADLQASGQLLPAWEVAAKFALRPSRLLNQPLTGKGQLHADATHLSGVAATLALGQNQLALDGNFGAPGEQLRWTVDAKQLSAAGSQSAGLTGALAASGVLEGTMAAPRSSFSADAKGLGLAGAKRAPADSLLHANGQVALAGADRHLELTVQGSAQRFNPAAFGAYPAGNIGADFDAHGQLGKEQRVALNLALQPSTLSNAPLSGYAKLVAGMVAGAAQVDNADIDLHLGPNTLQARGKFGAANDRLTWNIAAPQLSSAGPQFGGALNGSGVVSGSAAAPALSLTLEGKDLRFSNQQVASLRASATLGSGHGAADPLVSEIAIDGYASASTAGSSTSTSTGTTGKTGTTSTTGTTAAPGFALATARLQTSGTRGAHTLLLSARNDDMDVSGQLAGGWNGSAWAGSLDRLVNRGRFAFTLQAPVPLRLAGPAGSGLAGLAQPEQITLNNAVFKLPGGSIDLQQLQKQGPRWTSRGQAGGIPLAYLGQFSQAYRDSVSSDLTLGAQWSLDLQAATAPASAPVMAGMLHVYREQGDVTVGGDHPLTLGLRTLDARAEIVNNALRLQVALDGARAGQAHLDARTPLVQGRIADDAALTVTGSARIASLAWLTPFAGVPGLQFDGALTLALTGAGTIGTPTLNGELGGSKLQVNWPDQGIKLQNGQLQARLAGDQLQLQQLTFDGAEGTLRTDGWVRFAKGEASLQMKLVADKLMLLSRPDRTVVLSGESTLLRDAKRFQLDGKFKAERALIELASQDTPTLSDDVVVLGKAGSPPPAARTEAPTLPLNIDVDTDLGNNFKLRGKGLDAQLEGAVRLRVQDRRPLRANGSIRVASGTYAAYGQKLTIARGVLNFTGAYDNPGLNVLAVRKRPEGEALNELNVEAGVEVRGTALAPTAKLVSTPTVPDSDKLAWLVLGHGAEGTGSDEMGILSTAAGALFGGAGSGGGMQAKLAGALGLDEVGLGSSSANGSAGQAKGLESTVVTVGKRLSQRAYLSFEQGTSTASSLVKLRYKLTQRISLQFQTGVNSAIDVLYTWAFD